MIVSAIILILIFLVFGVYNYSIGRKFRNLYKDALKKKKNEKTNPFKEIIKSEEK